MTSSMTGYRGPTGMSANQTSTGSPIKTKNPSGLRQFQKFSPEQMQIFQNMSDMAGPDSYLSKLAGGDQSLFEEIEAPAHRQFQGKIGDIASRFSQPGTGARKSSGFQNTMTSAASNFAQELQGNRQNLQRQALSDLTQMSQMLMGQSPYEQYMKPEKEGFDWGGLLGGLGGATAGFFAGGPVGALSGAGMGYNAFGRGGSGSSGGGIGSFTGTQGWKPSWSGQGSNSSLLQQAQNLRT